MMNSIVERARKIVTNLYERNMISWNDLDREVVFVIQALNAEVQRLESLANKNDSFERDEAAAAKVREFIRNH